MEPVDIFDKLSADPLLGKVAALRGFEAYPFCRECTPDLDLAPAEVRSGGRTVVMFGSNDYLGLTRDRRVVEAAVQAVRSYGSGCSGSRLLNGTTKLHLRLEEDLARFLRKPAVMLLGTGFQANLVLGSLAGIRDVIVADEYCHASLEAGLRLAYARKARFRHNDPVSLADALGGCRPEEGKLVVAEGVYSMDGDLADLPAILKLTAEQRARIYLDDAHGLGIVGRDGRGTTEYFGLEAKVDIIAGTFSKSLASSGGFVAGPASVIEYLRHGAAPFTYSAALPPAALAAAAAALDIVRTEPEHRQRLAVLTGHCRRLLREAGFAVADGVTPIVIVHPAEQKSRDLASLEVARLASVLWDEGYCVNAVLGTAASSPRWRINIMASHTEEQIEGLVRSFRDAAERVGRQLQHMGGEDVRRNA